MKALIAKLSWGVLTAIVLCAAISLVIITILSGTGITFSDMWLNIKSAYEETTGNLSSQAAKTQRPDEITSYNLFTSVEHSNFVVITGTRYRSSQNPEIEYQWCYISRNNGLGRHTSGLTLATIDKAGRKNVPDFDPASLKKFSLTEQSVQKLITSHCRFQ